MTDQENQLWKVDLHIHTRYSRDCLMDPAAVIARAREVGLDRIAITEHDNIGGALATRELAPEFVLVGEEIMTTVGELIAYFVEEEVPPGLTPAEAIARLREQGAVISISHPLDSWRHAAMGEANVLSIIDQVDALEGFNARSLYREDNGRAQALAKEHGKLITAGSDAHSLVEIGRGYLLMPPFHDKASFLESLAQARPEGLETPLWVHGSSFLAKWRKRLFGVQD